MSDWPTVMLVEDSAADVAALSRAFRRWHGDAHVHHVADGEAALAHFHQVHRGRARPPELVLLDLNLGRTGGLDVLAEVKGDSALRRIPIVVLTSSLAERDIAAAYGLGANAVVSKPLELPDLYRTLGRLLDFWLLEASQSRPSATGAKS